MRVSVCDGLGRPVRARGLATWLAGVAPARARGEVTVALVSDAKIRTLNREHRRVDRATDVLSFPSVLVSSDDVTSNGAPRAREGRPKGLPHRKRKPPAQGRLAKPLDPRKPKRQGNRDAHRGGKSTVGALHLQHRWGRPLGLPTQLGDIVIATGVARRQAREQGHSLEHELRVLALHGLLHLLGYDHERDAGTMARVERRLRRRGGLTEGLIERGLDA